MTATRTATAYDRLLDALRAHGSRVRANGTKATAQCPAHQDRHPSLSVRRIEGQVLAHCFAGCEVAEVMGALGMATRDLFDEPKGARYVYTDAEGVTVLRTVHRTPDKRFRQDVRDGSVVPLYRLPAVAKAVEGDMTVYVVEGEKDVHALESLGAVATTAPQGASNWHHVDPTPLYGAKVVVVADADDSGDRYARAVGESLDGMVASLRVVRAKVGKDAADHVAAGHGLAEFVPHDLDDDLGELLDVVTASTVEVSRVAYLWDARIPIGSVTLLPGEEGLGKSTVGVRIMADLTRGTLAGEYDGKPQNVLVVSAEDGLDDVFVPRLTEAGADLDRVHFVRARVGVDDSKQDVIIPRDLAVLARAVRRYAAALVWVDSLVTTLPDEMKSIAYKDTAKVLKSLSGWAHDERVAVAAPWHLNKAAGSDTALRIMDSRAFRTAVRSMLLVVADPDADDGVMQGIVALDKSNAGTLAVPALRYRIRSAWYKVTEVDPDTGEVREVDASCGVAEWIDELDGDGRAIAREALIPRMERDGDPKRWLRDYLRERGECERSEVVDAADEAGFSTDQMKRAARSLGVVYRNDGYPRRSYWRLPDDGRCASRNAGHETDTTAPTAPTGEESHALSTSIYAGQRQSAQSGQSGGSHGTAPTGAPTGEAANPPDGDTADKPRELDLDPAPHGTETARCAKCGTPLRSPLSIAEGVCARCDEEAKP